MVRQFTAKDARELAGPTIEERVDDVLIEIEKAARNKKRQLRLHEDFWTTGGYHSKDNWLDACKLLEDPGYDVEFYSQYSGGFTDMYTLIRW